MTRLHERHVASIATPDATIRACFPRALAVYLLGPFNNWSSTATPMVEVEPGTWESRVQSRVPLERYAFFVWEPGARIARVVSRQRSEVRSQGSEVRGQKSEVSGSAVSDFCPLTSDL